MRVRKNPMTRWRRWWPACGSEPRGPCLDAVDYLKYRRAGGMDSPWPGTSAPLTTFLAPYRDAAHTLSAQAAEV